MRQQDYSIFKSLSASMEASEPAEYKIPDDIKARVKEIDNKIEEYRRVALITRDPDEYEQCVAFILELLKEKQWLIFQQML